MKNNFLFFNIELYLKKKKRKENLNKYSTINIYIY